MPSTPATTIEQQLATVQAGQLVAPTDPLVDAFRRVLDTLTVKYPHDSRQEVADIAVRAHQLLHRGQLTLWEFFAAVDGATPLALRGALTFEETCTAVVTWYTQQTP
jgi:hypothetical protein